MCFQEDADTQNLSEARTQPAPANQDPEETNRWLNYSDKLRGNILLLEIPWCPFGSPYQVPSSSSSRNSETEHPMPPPQQPGPLFQETPSPWSTL